MKERPILFTGAMIQALSTGKSQTRRTRNLNFVNKNPDRFKFLGFVPKHEALKAELGECIARFYDIEENRTLLFKNPYGTTGDHLWCRETWREALSDTHQCFAYKADNKYQCGKPAPQEDWNRWKPSIYMPKKASRHWLEVINIRIERLQDITEKDAIAEGIQLNPHFDPPLWRNYAFEEGIPEAWVKNPIDSYRSLWELLNGSESWQHNPWVWVVEFLNLKY